MTDKSIALDQTLKNPFTPDFGKIPAYFAGREEILSDLLSVLNENGVNICTLFVGARGTGKLRYLRIEATKSNVLNGFRLMQPQFLECWKILFRE